MKTQVLNDNGEVIEKSNLPIIPNHGDNVWHDGVIYIVDFCEFDFVNNIIRVFTHEG